MRKRKALALISVLLFISVFLMLVAALSWRVKMTGAFTGLNRDDLAAQNAAEAGLAHALYELSQNKTWATDITAQVLPDSQAQYKLRWDSLHSVNNLLSSTPQAGPQGPLTVPAHSAYVVVEGLCNSRSCRLEAVVTASGLSNNNPAIITTGNIAFGNNVDISGMRSLGDDTTIEANVISTKTSNDPNIISWTGSGVAKIAGSVMSNGSNSNAISSNINNSIVNGAIKNSQTVDPPVKVDITARVAAKTSAPTPILSGTSKTLSAGDYYFPAGINFPGDLDLQGANIYVSGDLTVSGSIQGKGAIFVTGSSQFHGNAQILSGDEQQIALYSKGDVTLDGFNGTAALETMAASSSAPPGELPYSTHLNNFKTWTGQMQAIQQEAYTLIKADPKAVMLDTTIGVKHFGDLAVPQKFGNPQVGGGYTSDFDYYNDILGHVCSTNYHSITRDTKETGVIPRLYQMVEDKGATGATRDFLLKKLAELQDPTDSHKGLFGWNDATQASNRLNANLTSGATEGLFDALNDYWRTDLHEKRTPLLKNLGGTLQTLDINRLGSCYFRGLVYTEGNLTAKNDLTIIGSLLGVGANSQLNLNDNVKVVYVPEISNRAGETLGTVSVKSWIRR